MLRCVYTVLTAGYETLNEQPMAAKSNIPFICFTNDPTMQSGTWQFRQMDLPAGEDTIRNQRTYKLQPHKYLPDFDASLYIDNSVLLKATPEAIFDAYDLSAGLALPAHSFRETLLDEFVHVVRDKLDSPDRISEQLKHYRRLHPGILSQKPYWNGILLRDHSNQTAAAAMDVWLEHLYRYSRRDQLSVQAAFATAGLQPNLIQLDNYESWFHSWPHATSRNTTLRGWTPAVETQSFKATNQISERHHKIAGSGAPQENPKPIEAPPLSQLIYKKPGWKRWLHGVPELTLRSFGRIFQTPFWQSRAFRLLQNRMLEITTSWFKDFWLLFLFRKETILQITPAPASTPKQNSIALYVHYSACGSVSQMVQKQLDVYRELGFNIVFISNAPLREEDRQRLVHNRAAMVIQRRNLGYDFGAWKDAFPLVLQNWPNATEILLVNDSCLGPIRPLAPALDAMRRAGNGMFGMQESLQGGTHLQSWFVLLRGAPAIADASRFFAKLHLSTSKWKTVQRGELRLSKMMLKWGHKVQAVHAYSGLVNAALEDLEQCIDLETMFFPGRRLNATKLFQMLNRRLADVPLNPAHHLWVSLTKSPYCSFLKTELVAKNPGNVPNVEDLWRLKIPAESLCPQQMLDAHLAQFPNNPTPASHEAPLPAL